ncbi:MAG: flagellin [Lutispora sp.]|nr:flagellin [Lutispora sp.]
MIIQHNVSGSYISKTPKVNNLKKSKAIAKLSSGYSINNAGDAAAGLSISEKMRAQIRGLNRAARNAQDGASLIQVAEAGLSNILEPPLQRLRELAIQASNGTLTFEDRVMVQDEAEQLIRGIDDISRNTHFNGIKLLNGNLKNPSLTKPPTKIPLAFEWQVNFSSPKAVNAIYPTDDGGFIIGGTTDEQASHHYENDRSSWVVKFDADGKVQWEAIIPKDEEYNGVYDIKQLSNGEFILTTRSHREIDSNTSYFEPIIYKLDTDGNIVSKKRLSGSNEYLFCINETKDGSFISTGTHFNGAIFRKLDINLNITKTIFFNNPLGSHFKSGLDVKETSDGGYIIVGQEAYENGDEKGIVTKIDPDFNVVWETKIDNEAFQSVVEDEDSTSKALGIKSIDMTTYQGAQEAISLIDNAIFYVSSERSKLGAYQNRLEHAVNNIETSAENLQAAESRIRDVDMAKEMMEFTKNNILQQAATAMLAQANQQPNGVLELLR